jgi:hypothetical protein
MIGALEIDGDPEEVQNLQEESQHFKKRIIASRSIDSVGFAVATLGSYLNFPTLSELLKAVIKEATKSMKLHSRNAASGKTIGF